MLQPQQTPQPNQLMVARIINLAMCMSIILYGVVLFITNKATSFDVVAADQFAPWVLGSLATVFLSLFLHRSLVAGQKSLASSFPKYIFCLALNESAAMLGFVCVFISESGNGLPYLLGAGMALVANLLIFPRG